MDYIELGPAPGEESCAEVGAADYQTQSIRECTVFKRMLDRLFPIPEALPLTYVTRSHRHDFGSYRELAIKVDGSAETYTAALDFAMTVERNAPANWDAIAQYELAWFELRDVYRAAITAGRLQATEVPMHFHSAGPPALSASASFAELLSAYPLSMSLPSSTSPTTANDQRAMRQERLRRIHLDCGVAPEALTLPFGQVLWFVSVVLDVEVHAGPLGFTRSLYEYATGAQEADACEAVRGHLRRVAPHVDVVKASARRSTCEHPVELAFPELVRRSCTQ